MPPRSGSPSKWSRTATTDGGASRAPQRTRLTGALLELLAEVFFELAVVATGHLIGRAFPTSNRLTDGEAAFVGVLFWMAVIASVLYWRLG